MRDKWQRFCRESAERGQALNRNCARFGYKANGLTAANNRAKASQSRAEGAYVGGANAQGTRVPKRMLTMLNPRVDAYRLMDEHLW